MRVTLRQFAASKELVVSTILEGAKGLSHDDDARFVERFVAGDSSAFDSLYMQYYERVLGVARGILLDSDDALDATQEIFTQVYRHLPNFDGRSKFGTWLFRIAVNRSIQHARKIKYRSRLTQLNDAIDFPTAEPEGHSDPRVSEALVKLNPQDRALIVLFYWEEMTLAEIAESLNCSENAAKTRLYRARERFRLHYVPEGS